MCDNRFELSSVIQGYHVYKTLLCLLSESGREPDNSYDSFGVAIIENYNYTIVGHWPRNTSRSNSPPRVE